MAGQHDPIISTANKWRASSEMSTHFGSAPTSRHLPPSPRSARRVHGRTRPTHGHHRVSGRYTRRSRYMRFQQRAGQTLSSFGRSKYSTGPQRLPQHRDMLRIPCRHRSLSWLSRSLLRRRLSAKSKRRMSPCSGSCSVQVRHFFVERFAIGALREHRNQEGRGRPSSTSRSVRRILWGRRASHKVEARGIRTYHAVGIPARAVLDANRRATNPVKFDRATV